MDRYTNAAVEYQVAGIVRALDILRQHLFDQLRYGRYTNPSKYPVSDGVVVYIVRFVGDIRPLGSEISSLSIVCGGDIE